jgi:hypothetical protein
MSQHVWCDKDPSLFKSQTHRAHGPKVYNPSPAKVMFPFDWIFQTKYTKETFKISFAKWIPTLMILSYYTTEHCVIDCNIFCGH